MPSGAFLLSVAKGRAACMLLALLAAGAPPALSQWTKAMGQRGFVPGASFESSGIESVNMINGNVLLQIPLASMPAGRGGMGFDLKLIYNAALWDTTANYFPLPPDSPYYLNRYYTMSVTEGGGWGYNFSYRLIPETRAEPLGCCTYGQASGPNFITPKQAVWKFRLRAMLPDGSLHVLYLANTINDPYWQNASMQDQDAEEGGGWYAYAANGMASDAVVSDQRSPKAPQSLGANATYYTLDGSYIRVEVEAGTGHWWQWQDRSWTMYFPDGRKVTSSSSQLGQEIQTIYDRNNNSIQVVPQSVTCDATLASAVGCTVGTQHPAHVLTDDLERSITVGYPSLNLHYVRQQGNGGTLLWKVSWGNPNVNFSYNSAHLDNGVPAPITLQVGGTIHSVTSVDLPGYTAAMSYAFSYDPAGSGQLTQVAFPYGATVQYSYPPPGRGDDLLFYPLERKELHHDDQVDTWQYTSVSINTSSSVTNPDGGTVLHEFHTSNDALNLLAGHTYRITQPDGAMIEQVWSYFPPFFSYGNPNLRAELRTPARPEDPSARPTAIKEFGYDVNGNVRSVKEYDWTSYSGITHASAGMVSGWPTSTLRRTTTNTYHVSVLDSPPDPPDSPSFNFPSTNPDEYWKSSAPRLLDAVASTLVTGSDSYAGTGAFATFDYDDPRTTGNLTQERHWDSVKAATRPSSLSTGNAVVTQREYNQGNLTSVTDPKGNQTQYIYDANNLYVVKVVDPLTSQGNPRWQYSWDNTTTGLLLSRTDANGATVQYQYDVRGRPTLATEAGLRQTSTQYDDANRTATTSADLASLGDGQVQTKQFLDQTGRVFKMLSSDSDGSLGIETLQYQRADGAGYTYDVVSNPHRSTSEDSMGWTRTKTDRNGRTVEVERFGGADLPSPWGGNPNSAGKVQTQYSANQVTLTDEAGKVRVNTLDALGRLTNVAEDPSVLNYQTSYAYNALDDLRVVAQGAQTRTFEYSSLKRLTSATNPESGVTSYTYDDNGDLVKRTDAFDKVTCFGDLAGTTCDSSGAKGYDALNRPMKKAYSDGTPTVAYTYDTVKRGRLSSVGTSVSISNYTAYDALGRVTAGNQNTGGTAYPFGYAYNLLDGLTSMTYPSGRTVNYTYDSAGRANAVTGYASNITYRPHGAISSLTFGNGVIETAAYNNRLQPYSLEAVKSGNSLWKQENFYCSGEAGSCSNNSGNLISQKLTAPKTAAGTLVLATAFGYDTVNRITSAAETGAGTPWSQSFNFGSNQFGNLTQSGDGPPSGLNCATYDSTTNRCDASGFAYDPAGNLTVYGSRVLGYDAENRQIHLYDGIYWDYFYDGEGRRVKKTGNGSTTVYVYDAMGRLASEYESTLLGNQPDCVTCYLTADHLGSTRLVTDGVTGQVKRRYDYHPFGWEVNPGYGDRSTVTGYTTTDWSNPKFTGHPRDYESGLNLDYFGARYFSGAQGRFTSPDPLMASAKTSNPQTWNRYTYGLNNPLRFTDPTGLYTCEGTADECKQFEKTRAGLLKSKDSANAGKAYGKAGENNGVVVRFADKLPDRGGTVSPVDGGIRGDPSSPERFQANLLVTIQSGNIGNAETIAHEGSHVADYHAFANSLSIANQWGDQSLNITHMDTEVRAYNLSIRLATQGNQITNFGPCGLMTECKFPPGQMPAQRDDLIRQLLTHPGSIYKGLDTALFPELLKPRQE